MTEQPRRAAPADNDSDNDSGDGAIDDGLSISALEPEGESPRRRLPPGAARPLHRLWRASGVVALVTLVAIVFVAVAPHLPRPTPTRITPQYTALRASNDVARCLTGASWSHDGRQIAAVESGSCGALYTGPGPGPSQPNLLIFAATTGQQVASYMLDPAVHVALAQVGLKVGAISHYDISYYESNWSPDGRLIEVGFGVYGEQVGDVGVAVVTLTGAKRGHISVMLNTPDTANAMPVNGFDEIPSDRWDLAHGTHTTIYLSPALAYRWLPSDVLVADEPLPPTASAPAPVEQATPTAARGDPIGGQSFSLWRSGYLSLVNARSCGTDATGAQPLSAPYPYLMLFTTIWSPDGRYLLYSSVQARLPGRAQTGAQASVTASVNGLNPCDSGPSPDQLPSAPLHDKGLQSALTLLDPHSENQLTLAWSADGQRLAVATFAPAQSIGAVVIYDCATGAMLQRFTGDQFGASVGANDLAQNPVWSPDGSQLLLSISGTVAKLVILGPQSLGA